MLVTMTDIRTEVKEEFLIRMFFEEVCYGAGTLNHLEEGPQMLAFYLSLLEPQEDKDKFEYLYERYAPLMKRVAYQKLHDEQLAEDAVHNAFMKIIKSFCKIDDPNSHKTRRFLVVVTERAAIDILRKEKSSTRVSYEQIEPLLFVTPDMLEEISAQELAGMIANLPEIYRTVLELRTYHDLSEKQIATVLGISYAAVRKRLERARNLLAEAMGE